MGMDAGLLAEARAYALTGGGAGMITRNGRMVASWGYANLRYDVKSTTKSIGFTAAGLAIADGLININDHAQGHLAAFGVPPNSNAATGWLDDITLLQLATHTAGFDKQGGFIPLLYAPGTMWDYSDGGLNWLADVLTQVYREDLNSLLFRRVFSRLGIDGTDLVWRSNAFRGDTLNGVKRREFGSGIKINVDAMARIGYLYLRNGIWDGDQLLPSAFVNLVRRPSAAVVGLPVADPVDFPDATSHYGVAWFTNADGTIPEVPTDAYWGWGLLDSLIVVIPSLDIVAVRAGTAIGRTGWNADYDFIAPFLTPIARSVAPVVVPNVVGSTQTAAQSSISGAGLTLGSVSTASSGSVLAGRVISQEPPSGTSVGPGASVALVISSGSASVTVPGVVDLLQAAAEGAIAGAGLSVGAITTASSAMVLAGRVISQQPAGGASVAPGASVALVISTGPTMVTVPEVVELTRAAAESAIVAADLAVGTVGTAHSDTVPLGRVISQDPEGGSSAASGTAVALVVSSGPAIVTVPEVVGLPQGAAESALQDLGLAVGTVDTGISESVPAGSVMSQDPEAGASVDAGSSVALVVSIGPSAVVVPDVVGLAQAAAESAIVDAQLVIGTVGTASSDAVPEGHVISQQPAGGASVAPGVSVSLVISTGLPTVAVPDVVDLTQAAAESAIVAAGLALGGVSTASSDTVPAGRVISQQPAGGASVAPGASVALVVSSGVASVSGYLDFDGGNDRVVVASSTSLRLANAVTVEAWIRPRTIATNTSQDRVVRKGNNYELTISTGDTGCVSGTSGHVQWRATIAGTNSRICGGVLTRGCGITWPAPTTARASCCT